MARRIVTLPAAAFAALAAFLVVWAGMPRTLASEPHADTAVTDQSAEAQQVEVSPAARREAMVQRIDELLHARWQSAGVEPAPPATDAEFLRRASLDLTGVIPRASEVREFLADENPDKRQQLIDRLLASPRYATHMANTWRGRMLPDNAAAAAQPAQVLGVQQWLRSHFEQNTRYDGMVYDLLVSTKGSDVGPALYFQAHQLMPERLAASASELFLGMRLDCAQCHNHPFDRWSQKDFWGLAAFFARVRSDDGAMNMQRTYRLRDEAEGEVTLPDSEEVVPPKYLDGELAAARQYTSRRSQLALWITAPDNRYFSRATANVAWAHLFGRGLVHPVGDSGDHNPPSHPKLLDELAAYLAAVDFDLKELWRTLSSTEAYQLSSQPADGAERPPQLFAAMNAKALTPEQLYDSLLQASPRAAGLDPQSDARSAVMASSMVLDPSRVEFVLRMQSPGQDPTEYSAGILQALMVMNGRLMTEITSEESGGLLAALDAPFFSDRDRLDALFLATLSRLPNDEERSLYLQPLEYSADGEERRQVLSDTLWALLNSSEFTFNH